MCVPFYTQYIYEKVFSLYYYECVGLKTVTQQKKTPHKEKKMKTQWVKDVKYFYSSSSLINSTCSIIMMINLMRTKKKLNIINDNAEKQKQNKKTLIHSTIDNWQQN